MHKSLQFFFFSAINVYLFLFTINVYLFLFTINVFSTSTIYPEKKRQNNLFKSKDTANTQF